MSKSPVAVVVFDAVGTLIHPEPAAGLVYASIGRRFGSRLDSATVSRRFAEAFAREEEYDRARELRASEAREVERWRRIVTSVLDDVTDAEGCFHALFEHFSQPESWRCEADAAEVLSVLNAQGCLLGMASNYDSRLRRVVAGLSALRPLSFLAISSELGWRKPAPAFFVALAQLAGCAPERILFVGDDASNDFAGALQAGMQAVLFDPRGTAKDGRRIERLREVVPWA